MNSEKFSAVELMHLKHSLRHRDARTVIEEVGAWELVRESLQESDEQSLYRILCKFHFL